MISGKVTQLLSAAQQLEGLEALTLVQVQTEKGALTAADSLGVMPGCQVVVCQGGAAQAAFGTNCPVDAAVVCILPGER